MTAKEVRAERQRRSHVASEDEESDPDEEDSSSEEAILLPPAKRRREVSLPKPLALQATPTIIRSVSTSFTATVLKPFHPFWVVEGESQVFIWLLRIPTCKLESDDQIYAHTQTHTCQIRIKIGAGELQPNRRDESINDHYAFAGIPKLNAQVDNEFTF